jgi:hypothetical protein
VVAPSVVTILKSGGFKAGSDTATSKGLKFLQKIAKQVGKAKQITCTAPSPTTALSLQRGNSACVVMRLAGLKAKFVTKTKKGSTPSIAVTIGR